MSIDGQVYVESVCMTVALATGLQRAGIDHKLLRYRLGAGHYMNSARFQRKRNRHLAIAAQIFKSIGSSNPQQPDGFFRDIPRRSFEIIAVEQNGAERQGIQHVLCPITPRIKYSPTVIVPQAGNRTAGA